MRRSRIGLLIAAVILVIIGGLPAVAFAEPSPSASTDSHQDMLAGVLHGEGIVQTKKGPVRVAMQNGEATTLTQSSVTVRSSDGFTRTWTLGANLKVYDKRHTLQPGALKAGADLSIAGTAPTTPSAASSAGPSVEPSATAVPATYTAKIVFVRSS